MQTETVPSEILRIKVTETCPRRCVWCHKEGGRSGDPGRLVDMEWDDQTHAAIVKLASALRSSEAHLTGGEPTTSPSLPGIVRGLVAEGFLVKTTTIGCDVSKLAKLIQSGLRSYNFSLHALSAYDLAATQERPKLDWMRRQLNTELAAILAAKREGADVKLNIVIENRADLPRLVSVLSWAESMGVPVRLLNELRSGDSSVQVILDFLASKGAREVGRKVSVASSGASRVFETPKGRSLVVKQMRDLYLGSMCCGCPFMNDGCLERFYAVRLEKRVVVGVAEPWVRLCIIRNDRLAVMPLSEFLASQQLQEIRTLMAEPAHTSIQSTMSSDAWQRVL